jgi:cell wall-associated NlpC family hydrolase
MIKNVFFTVLSFGILFYILFISFNFLDKTISEDMKKISNNRIATIDNTVEEDKKVVFKERMIRNSKMFIGTPYQLGAVGDGYFDCSGFIYKLSIMSGCPVPRTTTFFMSKWKRVDDTFGNLPMFAHSGDKIAHIGLWEDQNIMVHASTSRGVEIRDITSQGGYWEKRFRYSVQLVSLDIYDK